MTNTRIDRTEGTHWRGVVVATVIADHEILDAKGRAIGGKAIVIRFMPAGQTVHRFGVLSYALRNGKEYGATPTKLSTSEDTTEAAIAAAERLMHAQGKRYASTFTQSTRSNP